MHLHAPGHQRRGHQVPAPTRSHTPAKSVRAQECSSWNMGHKAPREQSLRGVRRRSKSISEQNERKVSCGAIAVRGGGGWGMGGACDGDQVISRNWHSRNHRMFVQAGSHWRSIEDSCRVIPRHRFLDRTHGVLQEKMIATMSPCSVSHLEHGGGGWVAAREQQGLVQHMASGHGGTGRGVVGGDGRLSGGRMWMHGLHTGGDFYVCPTPSPMPCPLLLHPPPRLWPCALGCSSATPDDGPPRRGALRVPAEAGGVCVVVRLSPTVLRSGDDPVGCGY